MSGRVLMLVLAGGVLVGCSSAPPPAPPPPALAEAERWAVAGARMSAAENWAAAARAWRQAADRFASLRDDVREAVALHNLAGAERELGRFREAREPLERAASLNARAGRTNDWWRNQVALLQVRHGLGPDAALDAHLAEVADRAPAIADPQVRALFQNEAGLWRLQRGELDRAAACFEEAAVLFFRAGDRSGTAVVMANRALLDEARGRPREAAERWRTALAAFEALRDPAGIADALLGLGRSLTAAGEDLGRAEEALREAVRNYRTLGRPAAAQRALEQLRLCLRTRGRTEEAGRLESETPAPSGRE
ncbi:MAG TPA: hypothetical protein VNO52_11490 [Methylomirabilota bacterium]|nr:hypothetical protein [Methylomirabilota bacterium]